MSVHGTTGLRVGDASAMPYVTNGNIYAPVIMLAEKAADLIRGESPLAPSSAPWYNHRTGTPLDPPTADPPNRTPLAATQHPAGPAD